MKLQSLLVYIMGMLIATSVTGNAFADPPSPTIKFIGLDKGCKVLEITDMDGHKKGFISEIVVEDSFLDFDNPTVVPEAPTTSDLHTTVFNYGLDDKENPDKVTLRICLSAGEDSGSFTITAFDSQKNRQKTKVEVFEDKRDFLSLSVRIPNKKVDCNDPKNIIQTDNLKDPRLTCDFDGKNTIVSVENVTKINDRLPSTIAIKVDPPSELFLIVVEFCVLTDAGRLCPEDVEFDLEFQGPEESVVGGEILGIDKTSLFVAGAAANAGWIIPVVGVTAAGIAGLLLRKRIKN